MKKLLLLALLPVISSNLFAQWLPSVATSGPISYVGGNVGIGTANPTSALQVVIGGTDAGNDYASINITTTGSGSVYGPILYLNGLSAAGGRMWGLVSSGPPDAAATGSSGNFAIYDSQAGSRLVINSSGNVGIGTTNPANGLLVAQGLITSQTANSLSPGNNDAFSLFAGGFGYSDGARQSLVWSQQGLNLARFGTEYNAARGQIDFVWRDLYNRGPAATESMRLTGGGYLGIGTSQPDQRLTVNGTIHSTEVKVDINVPAPDYVFNADYKLARPSEIKNYIIRNHHLPEIPSAAEMEKNGLDLAKMNTKLLQKVEELTLYLIDQDRQLARQRKEIRLQQAKAKQQEGRIVALEKAFAQSHNHNK